MTDRRISNFIFVLIAGFVVDGRGYINPNSNFKNIWDCGPSVRFFYDFYKKTSYPIRKRQWNRAEKFKPEWA